MKNSWNRIKQVIIVLNDELSKNSSEYRLRLKELGKEVTVVVLSKMKENQINKDDETIVLTNKDFKLFGKPKSDQAKKMYNNNFDLQLRFNSFEGRFKKRADKIKAKITVGINIEGENNFFDININTKQNSIEHLINFTKEILEKIK